MVRPSPAGDLDAVALETALLETWKNEETFQQSIRSNRDGAPLIFLEGPPTAPPWPTAPLAHTAGASPWW